MTAKDEKNFEIIKIENDIPYADLMIYHESDICSQIVGKKPSW
jgi:hypothetical protein